MIMERYVLIGLDGSGKSSNIDKLKQDPLFRNYSFVWVRWEPKLLRPLYRIIHKKTNRENADTRESQNHTPQDERAKAGAAYSQKQSLKKRIFSNRFFGKVWMLLALTDYWLQFHRKVSRVKKKGCPIVFDRYYFDLFVDQGLNIGYSPEQILRTIRRHAFLFPKIDKVIYIRVAPEICFARKQDIPNMDYLTSRYAVYELLSREAGWVTVDGEKPLEAVYASVKDHILITKSCAVENESVCA